MRQHGEDRGHALYGDLMVFSGTANRALAEENDYMVLMDHSPEIRLLTEDGIFIVEVEESSRGDTYLRIDKHPDSYRPSLNQ